ncbi:protein timeless isoform X2 [Aedes aegypti]|uniref:Timeless n=1 Tax=Aedes aegypti TaxID=7159 RepID=A0A6I8TTC6_AEDAE|nr:protein timeless isoform X2 [Aedes aegypti]
MEWLLANPQINSTFGSLGSFVDDIYLVNDDALRTLEEIICKLALEDTSLRTFRRAIGFGQNVKNDILPLLVNTKDAEIIDTTIRLLVNLTVPIECLLPVELFSKSEIGCHTIFELNKLLVTSKEAFIEWKTTKAVVDHMKTILEKDSKLSIDNCDSINNCLLLLRNILHIPEGNATSGPGPHHQNSNHNTSFQNQIIWNLFTQSVDKLLIHLMSCPQRAYWAVTMAQLIALMYKDQHMSTLQKLLNLWFESTLSESSEDNESNTSPPQQCSGDSSPMLTSDPTSDSSDNGSGKMPSSISKATDEVDQASRKTAEYPSQIIMARVIKSHQMYHQSIKVIEGVSCFVKHPSCIKPVTQSEPSSTKQVIDSKQVKPLSVSPDLLDEIHTVRPSLQIQPLQKSPTPVSSSPKSETEISTSEGANKPACSGDNNVFTQPGEDSIPTNSNTKAKLPASTTNGQTQKEKNQISQSETSDCGYGTQVEKESISTSSNEEDGPNQKPLHQKPPPNQKQRFNAANKSRNPTTIHEKKELRRKKLVKRSKSNIINMKGLMHHAPSDDDISHILKEFTVDFLLKGYGFLVQELHAQLLSDLQVQIDTSHFFWLVTYFLKFASQLELDLEHINTVLSFEIVSYLAYEGVMLCEQLEQLNREPHNDLLPCLRRIHLVVTAIREFLQALDTYKKSSHLTKEDKDRLKLLQLQICATEDLRCLFVLLLRCYNPNVQSRQYLQDLIVTNHILLLLLDGVQGIAKANNGDMLVHIKQFATVEIMHQYGLLLEDFRDNGAFVNDCIFTMMHHVGGDLGQINVLFQPNILKTYSQIWETEYEICDDWSDLIEYVIHKFINTPQPSPLASTLPEISTQLLSGINPWTQEEKDSLQWYYVQCKQSSCLVADILNLFQESGNQQKTRVSIIEQLWEQDIISLMQYDDLMKVENPGYERNVQTPAFSVASCNSGKRDDENKTPSMAIDDIQVLRDRLLKENKSNMIVWLQKSLLNCCFVKLNVLSGNMYISSSIDENSNVVVMESVSYHCITKKQSIPVVPWNQEQFSILTYQPFVLLLHKLGFHLPADAKKMFVRIPEFWTADILYNIALKLGPVEQSIIKFDLNCLQKVLLMEKDVKVEPGPMSNSTLDGYTVLARSNKQNPVNSFTSDTNTGWLHVVMRNKNVDTARLVDMPGPSKVIDSANVVHPSAKAASSPTVITQSKLTHDLSVIVEASNDDEVPTEDDVNADDDDDDDDDDDALEGPCLEEHDVVSACETASVASDLTRMYVSDEDDKHDIVPSSIL